MKGIFLICLCLPPALRAQPVLRLTAGTNVTAAPSFMNAGDRLSPAVSLSLLYRLKLRLQAGLSLGWTQLRNKDAGSVSIGGTSSPGAITFHYYEAAQAVPLTLEVNYLVPSTGGGSYLYIGGHAGVLLALGSKSMKPFTTSPYPGTYDIYYRNTAGFTGGMQTGFVQHVGDRLTLGLSLQVNAFLCRLRETSDGTTYPAGRPRQTAPPDRMIALFYFPVGVGVGWML